LTNLAFRGASHPAGITKSGNAKFCQLHWRQNILVKITKIRHSQWWQNTLLENTKNPASHFGGIPKSGIAKLQQLHWRQNNLVKISKIRHSQTQHTQGQVTLPELLNPALPNWHTYTGGKTPW
jgi:hypothetical protein